MDDGIRLRCPSCRHEEPLAPQACPSCGETMRVVTSRRSMSPVLLVVVLLLVGPFGIGLIWGSNRMGATAKWVLTILTLAYTAAGFWYAYVAYRAIMTQMDEIMGQMQI